ncbi:MAG: enoyl-CoA hydratase/isomerase family protein [Betaproteobacteria bacterium]|nr:MAG: enoyl-CoA hydratase/isomerase family protein [Betaproteobacteria bacterium]
MDYPTMSAELVTVQKFSTHTELSLNRGDKANALSAELVDALTNAVDAAHQDGTQLLSIRGAGKNFCAGFDLSSLDRETDETLIERLRRAECLLQSIYHAPFATVALIQGGAYGAGFDIAMACDYRIAAPESRFRMPGWRMGLALGTRRTAARVGQETAFSFLRAAAVIDANSALASKFITEIADPVTWPRRLDEISAELRALPSGSYPRLKRILLNDTRTADLQDLLDSLRAEPLKPRMLRYVESKS